MRIVVKMVAAILALALPAASNAQNSVDIVQIWSNFIASRSAAIACNALDKSSDDQFLANQMNISLRAAQALQQRNPSISANELAQEMETASKSIDGKVRAEISQGGCQSERVEQLLRLYKMHSNMKF